MGGAAPSAPKGREESRPGSAGRGCDGAQPPKDGEDACMGDAAPSAPKGVEESRPGSAGRGCDGAQPPKDGEDACMGGAAPSAPKGREESRPGSAGRGCDGAQPPRDGEDACMGGAAPSAPKGREKDGDPAGNDAPVVVIVSEVRAEGSPDYPSPGPRPPSPVGRERALGFGPWPEAEVDEQPGGLPEGGRRWSATPERERRRALHLRSGDHNDRMPKACQRERSPPGREPSAPAERGDLGPYPRRRPSATPSGSAVPFPRFRRSVDLRPPSGNPAGCPGPPRARENDQLRGALG